MHGVTLFYYENLQKMLLKVLHLINKINSDILHIYNVKNILLATHFQLSFNPFWHLSVESCVCHSIECKPLTPMKCIRRFAGVTQHMIYIYRTWMSLSLGMHNTIKHVCMLTKPNVQRREMYTSQASNQWIDFSVLCPLPAASGVSRTWCGEGHKGYWVCT